MKETLDIHILITFCTYATYYNNKWTSHKNKYVEPVQPVQMVIYNSNTYRKNFSWLHFSNEPSIQDRQQSQGPTVLHFFKLLLRCPTANFRPLTKGQPHLLDANHCVLIILTQRSPGVSNKIGSLSLAKYLVEIEPRTFKFQL